jgi:hypothetical protein
MTGPEHWREAEKILELTSLEDHYRNYHLQAAQVHATLALAAATALPGQHPGDWEREIWAFGPGPGESDVTP